MTLVHGAKTVETRWAEIHSDLSRSKSGLTWALAGNRSDSFCQACRESLESRRTVQRRQAHVEQTKTVGPTLRFKECAVELFFGFYDPTAALAQNLRQPAIMPWPHVVVRPILHVALRTIAAIVQHYHHGV